jgi:hypothetical protein
MLLSFDEIVGVDVDDVTADGLGWVKSQGQVLVLWVDGARLLVERTFVDGVRTWVVNHFAENRKDNFFKLRNCDREKDKRISNYKLINNWFVTAITLLWLTVQDKLHYWYVDFSSGVMLWTFSIFLYCLEIENEINFCKKMFER